VSAAGSRRGPCWRRSSTTASARSRAWTTGTTGAGPSPRSRRSSVRTRSAWAVLPVPPTATSDTTRSGDTGARAHSTNSALSRCHPWKCGAGCRG
jgi:hypothetical protein